MFPIIVGTMLALSVLSTPSAMLTPLAQNQVISEQVYSLSDRYPNTFVNDVFADNIMLTMAYMRGAVTDGKNVDWSKVNEDFVYSMELKPGETFAFHDEVLP